MSITVQVQLEWFKCVVAKQCKIPSSWNKYSVSRSVSSAALALIFQHSPLQVQWNELLPCRKQWCGVMRVPRAQSVQPGDGLCAGRGPVCGVDSGWCNSEGLCLQNPCWEHDMLFRGVVSGSSLPSPRALHDVMSDWGIPSLLKSMSHSPVVQAGLKATSCSH